MAYWKALFSQEVWCFFPIFNIFLERTKCPRFGVIFSLKFLKVGLLEWSLCLLPGQSLTTLEDFLKARHQGRGGFCQQGLENLGLSIVNSAITTRRIFSGFFRCIFGGVGVLEKLIGWQSCRVTSMCLPCFTGFAWVKRPCTCRSGG